MEGPTAGDDASWSPRVIWYGLDEPLPERRLLRAGPLSAVLEGGDLRYVKLGDEEIVRRLYVAVRDRNWGTIEPRYTAYDVHDDGQAFSVRFTAEHVAGDVDFVWDGVIQGTSAGVITCSMDGVARKTFLRNRIGFCVLHPVELAGTPATVETPDGTVEGTFPERISPHQPFKEMQSLAHPMPSGAQVTIRFEGDLFEMEDQRNWTDASYKTYCTPLRLPYPVEIEAGQRVRQSVTIEVKAATTMGSVEPRATAYEVRVGAESIGSLPPIGLGVASHGKPLSERELDLLRRLRPAHLRVMLDLDGDDWKARFALADREAAALGAGLEVEALAGEDGSGLSELMQALAAAEAPVARVLVFPESGMVTTESVMTRARQLAAEVGQSAPIGGGSRAYFTEFNRASLPLAAMDVVGYTINPQVHAFDNASMVETLAAKATTVSSAREIAEGRPLAVGPITLRPRFNPNATGPDPEPAPGELPPEVDNRQPSLFAAGWTVGSVRHLAEAGADSLTYFETTGWRGLIERSDHPLTVRAFASRPGMIFPVYHVLAALGEFAGGSLLPVELSDGLAVEAIALQRDDRLRVLVASFVDAPIALSLHLPAIESPSVRTLDEQTFSAATDDPNALETTKRPLVVDVDRGANLEMKPFGISFIDGRVKHYV